MASTPCDPCEGATTQETTIARGGRKYKIKFDAVPGTMSNYGPDVCRVWSIEGPIKKSEREEGDSEKGSDRGSRNRFTYYLLSFINPAVPPASTMGRANSYMPGHLIAASLGGPNDTRNFVPQQKQSNNAGGWYEMEDWIRGCLGPSGTGYMKVVLSYPSATVPGLSKYIPNVFTATVTIGSKQHPPFSLRQNSVTFTPPTSCT